MTFRSTWVSIAAGVLLTVGALRGQVPVTPGITLIPGNFTPGSQPDGNTVIFEAPDGLIVMDTGRYADHSTAILRYAGSRIPIAAIVNSHWHLDHIGGNGRLRAAFPGVKVYASGALPEARAGFLATYRRQLESLLAAPGTSDADRTKYLIDAALIDSADRLAPTVVVDKSGVMEIAGRELEIGLERFAVTAGDLWIYDRDSRTLATGDLVTLPVPFLDTACPPRWKDSLDRLGQLQAQRVIPGHGRVLTRREFDTYRTQFAALVQCAAGSGDKAGCIDGWLTGTADLVSASDRDFSRSLMDYYMDVLRRPAAETDKLCGK